MLVYIHAIHTYVFPGCYTTASPKYVVNAIYAPSTRYWLGAVTFHRLQARRQARRHILARISAAHGVALRHALQICSTQCAAHGIPDAAFGWPLNVCPSKSMQRKGRTLPLGETARLKLERPGNFSGRATRYVRPIPSPSLTLLPACMLPGDISAYCVRGGPSFASAPARFASMIATAWGHKGCMDIADQRARCHPLFDWLLRCHRAFTAAAYKLPGAPSWNMPGVLVPVPRRRCHDNVHP